MSSVDNDLVDNEQILFRTKKHLIIFIAPVFLLIVSLIGTPYLQANPILAKIQWVPWLVTFVFWSYYALEYYTSDFVVTNRRITMKEGFFNRHINDLRLSSISQVNVTQGIFAQLFRYGDVSINTFGAFDVFTTIAKPLQFQKAVNEQLFKVRR